MRDQRDDMDMPRRGPQDTAQEERGGRHRHAPPAPRASSFSPGEQPGTVPFRTRPLRQQQVRWHDGEEPDEAPAGRRGAATSRGTRAGTWFRGLTGSLALGLLLVSLALIAVQIWADQQGQAGPGIGMTTTHVIGSVLALVLQRFAERNRDRRGAAALLAQLLVVFGILWFWWWL
ncbi:hypothetical protein ACL03H_11620 [Saccharopolyspora sp. MS10]|uniref:hypothetical protein n=1 Tax=Saccharopolyspora sp. MS10 TaxID=3385973 RepID=UPI0039A3062D